MHKLSTISKLSILATLGSLLVAPSLLAQTDTSASSIGLEVSAPLYEFTVDPGQNVQDIIKIRNKGAKSNTFYPRVVDFRSNNIDGTPELLEPGEGDDTYALAKWINFTKEAVTLDSQKSEAFNFNITIPVDAEPGGHYGAILFSTEPIPAVGTGLALEAVVGSLILVRVSGDVNEAASIKEFTTDKQSYETAKVNFDTIVTNSGNTHVQPKGTITIKNLLGGTVAALDVNQLSANVLPGSDRKFTIAWDDPGFKVGYYTATVTLNYGNPAKTMTAQTTFWILPWKTLLIALVVLVVLVVILTQAVKRYNAWVVARAQKQQPSG
ncbi:MAG TPA: hypothetical protein VIH52_03585 [Candidatus Nanoarchaeia archaeon]|nr:hypothetical protein [uncultured archaeon]